MSKKYRVMLDVTVDPASRCKPLEGIDDWRTALRPYGMEVHAVAAVEDDLSIIEAMLAAPRPKKGA